MIVYSLPSLTRNLSLTKLLEQFAVIVRLKPSVYTRSIVPPRYLLISNFDVLSYSYGVSKNSFSSGVLRLNSAFSTSVNVICISITSALKGMVMLLGKKFAMIPPDPREWSIDHKRSLNSPPWPSRGNTIALIVCSTLSFVVSRPS